MYTFFRTYFSNCFNADIEMIWTSTFKFCPTLFIGIKSLLIKNVFQHENTLGKWLHFVPSGYILFRHPTVFPLNFD